MFVSYIHTLNYTELNCICVVGGYKMPLYWAKHEYIQYCLYILSPTSCNGNTPITLSPTRLLYSLKFESKGMKLYPLGEYQKIEKMWSLQPVKITLSYLKVRDRYGSLFLKEANIFDYVCEEESPTHCLMSRHVEIRRSFLVWKVITLWLAESREHKLVRSNRWRQAF